MGKKKRSRQISGAKEAKGGGALAGPIDRGRQSPGVGRNRARRWTPTQQPLKTLPSPEGDMAEGPLGDKRNTPWLLLPWLVRLLYSADELLLPLLLQLTLKAKERNEILRKRKLENKLMPSELSSH
jgi:hypothetical protein